MPSHLANWMKDEKRKVRERNKRLNNLVNSGTLGNTVNYQLVTKEKDMKGCKEPMKGKKPMPMPKKKKK